MCVRQKKRTNALDAFDGEAKNWFKGHLLPLSTENKYYLRRSLFLKQGKKNWAKNEKKNVTCVTTLSNQ